MKKKVLCFLLAFAMVFSLFPTAVIAVGEDDVAKIGETGYATLLDAIKAAEVSTEPVTIEILKDSTESLKEKVNGTWQSQQRDKGVYTIDLKGHTITFSDDSSLNLGGTKTLMDSVGGGGITANGSTVAVSGNSNQKDLLLTITGGTYSASPDSYGAPFGFYGASMTGDCTATINIEGGTFNGFQFGLGTLNISGGIFTGNFKTTYEPTGYSHALNISGGDFTECRFGYSRGYYPNVTFEDGFDPGLNGEPGPTVIITGGTFAFNPSNYVPETGGYTVTKAEGDNIWTVESPYVAKIGNTTYGSLAEAIAAVPENGETPTEIKLGMDVELSEQLEISKAITLDGAKHIIKAADGATWGTDNDNKSLVLVDAANATIKNVTLNANGKAAVGLNFYKVANGATENVTITGANPTMAMIVNASKVTATGKLDVDGGINVAWGENINAEDVPETACKFDASDATLTALGVYADQQDMVRSGNRITVNVPGTGWTNAVVLGKGIVCTPIANQEAMLSGMIGTTEYKAAGTLADMITLAAQAPETGATNITVTLLKDVELAKGLDISGAITLDLNGKTINTASTGYTEDYVFAVLHGGNLTVKDSGENGKINGANVSSCCIKMTKANDIAADLIAANPATLTVEGGEIIGHYYGISGNGNTGRENTAVTIKGGTIRGTVDNDNVGIYNPQKGTLTIDGGVIVGDTGIYVKSGDVTATINAGTIEATGTAKAYKAAGLFNSTGDAIAFENCDYPGGTPTASINGGTFVSAHGNAVASYAQGDRTPITGFISGGTFSSEPAAELLATGCFTVPNGNGYKVMSASDAVAEIVNGGKYLSLADAVAAATSGQTITLLQNVENVGTLSLKAGVTLNGNSKEITGNSQICINAAGGTVQNVVFENIHNTANLSDAEKIKYGVERVGKQTAVLCYDLTGTATVTGCSFDNIDWDAIQITPRAGATVNITGNTFKHTNAESAIRYVHVQSAKNVAFTANVNANKFYNCDKLAETGIEVYYPTNEANVKCSGNYMDAPMAVCIGTGDSYNNAYEKAFPFKDETLANNVTISAIIDRGNIYLYPTLAEAIAAAEDGETVKLVNDVTTNEKIVVTKSITIDLGDKTVTRTGPDDAKDKDNGCAFEVDNSAAVVTVTNGTVDCTKVSGITNNQGAPYNTEVDAFVARAGAFVLSKLTVKVNTEAGSCAYAKDGAKVTILSGDYSNAYTPVTASKGMVLNQANVETQLIFVSGGTFTGKSPADGDDSGKVKSFLATGYACTKIADNKYTVAAQTKVETEVKVTDGDKIVIKTEDTQAPAQEVQVTNPDGVDAEAVAEAINEVLDNSEVAKVDTGIEDAANIETIAISFKDESGDAVTLNDDEKTTITTKVSIIPVATAVESVNNEVKVTELKFDVKPMATVKVDNVEYTTKFQPEEGKKITFRLPVPYDWSGYVKVTHTDDNGSLIEEYLSKVLGSGDNKYVELSAGQFSGFGVAQLGADEDPDDFDVDVAQVGGATYKKSEFQDAVNAAQAGDLTIKLLNNVEINAIQVYDANEELEKFEFIQLSKNVMVDRNGYEFHVQHNFKLADEGTATEEGDYEQDDTAWRFVFTDLKSEVNVVAEVSGTATGANGAFKKGTDEITVKIKLTDTNGNALTSYAGAYVKVTFSDYVEVTTSPSGDYWSNSDGTYTFYNADGATEVSGGVIGVFKVKGVKSTGGVDEVIAEIEDAYYVERAMDAMNADYCVAVTPVNGSAKINGEILMTVTATGKTYNGQPAAVSANVTEPTTGYEISDPTYFKATKDSQNEYVKGEALTAAPKDAGDYFVEYTATATGYDSTTKGVGYTISPQSLTLTLNVANDYKYDGRAKDLLDGETPYEISGVVEGDDEPTVTYAVMYKAKENDAAQPFIGTKGTNIGYYEVTASLNMTGITNYTWTQPEVDPGNVKTVRITEPDYYIYTSSYMRTGAGYDMVYVFVQGDAHPTYTVGSKTYKMYNINALGYGFTPGDDDDTTMHVATGVSGTKTEGYNVYACLVAHGDDSATINWTKYNSTLAGTIVMTSKNGEKQVCDVNASKLVDLADAVAVVTTYNNSFTDAQRTTYMATIIRADVNRDGKVDVADDAGDIKAVVITIPTDESD